jgi:uncharacterized protein YkwD
MANPGPGILAADHPGPLNLLSTTTFPPSATTTVAVAIPAAPVATHAVAPAPVEQPAPAEAAAPAPVPAAAPAAPAAPAEEQVPTAPEQAAPAAAESAPVSEVPAPAPVAPAVLSVAGDAGSEDAFWQLTNATRASIGAGALRFDAGLQAYARQQAHAMADAGQIFHSNISNLLGAWSLVGENVGVGPSVGAINNALIASPGHYRNISDPAFTAMGVGVVIDGAGRVFTAHVFGA